MSEFKNKFKKKYLYLTLILISLTTQAALFQNCGKVQSVSGDSVDLGNSAPAPCDLPWGPTIQDGQSTPAYQAMSVANGQACVSELRECSNGSLSGTFQYESCLVGPPTYVYSWLVGAYGSCSATACGTQGTQNRSVVCKRNDNATVADSFCPTPKPVDLQFCSAAACPPPPPPSGSYTHFVRPDGGTSAQCNGTANAAYPGSGTNLNCAFKSITYALGMRTPSKLKSGDKLFIESGTYKIGHKQPGYEMNLGSCYDSYAAECLMSKIPSGVTIEGNCTNRPKLVGVESIYAIFDLTGSSNITLKCLEITDNVACITRHNTANGQQKKPCKTTAPFGEWASVGITALDSSSVLFDRVNIHGFAANGVKAARVNNWTFQDSNIDANGWAGWDGGFGATTSSNTGTIKFLRTSISYNGCMEKAGGGYEGCWGQISGGYGDGIGTEATAGTWIFDTATVVGNTSDGIDMLYVKNPGGNVIVKNSYIADNAGNQIKTNKDSLIENNVVVGSCSFHEQFGGTMTAGEYCRANGNALSIGLSAGEVSTIRNNTITGEGDCLIMNSSASTGGGTVNINGNILDGRADYTSGGQQLSCFHYYNGTGTLTKNVSSNLIYNVKEGCQAGQICQNPKFVDPNYSSFDPHLQAGSPAVGLGANLNLIPLP